MRVFAYDENLKFANLLNLDSIRQGWNKKRRKGIDPL